MAEDNAAAAPSAPATTTGTAQDPWEGPYVPPLSERPAPEIPGGWILPLALAAGLFGIWAFTRWRESHRQGMEAARKLANHLRRLGEPLTLSERRLLKSSLRQVKSEERERLLNEPDALKAYLDRRQAGDEATRDTLGRKLAYRIPERTESLRVGTRLHLAVAGFPGRFEAMVREVSEGALSLDLIGPNLRRVPFASGDLVAGTLVGLRPERKFICRVIDCAEEGPALICRLSHGDILSSSRI